jgi:hypothetical protein
LLNQYIVDYTRSDHPHALAIEATLTAVLGVVWPTQKAKKKEREDFGLLGWFGHPKRPKLILFLF